MAAEPRISALLKIFAALRETKLRYRKKTSPINARTAFQNGLGYLGSGHPLRPTSTGLKMAFRTYLVIDVV